MRRIYLLLFTVCFAIAVNAQNVAVTGADAATNAASPFATLSAAFASINLTAQTGNTITITIINNTTEPVGGAILNNGAWTSMSIQPSGGASRTITGAATAGLPLIDFNGADNVTVDGLNSGGNSLTISNTTVSATSGTSTIRFQGDASNNTITRCSLQGSGTMAVGTNGGVVWVGSAAVSTGNDNNTISSCDIGPAGANLPSKGIYFSGTSNALGNNGSLISNNNFFDFFNAGTTSAGVYITTGTPDCNISNNKFYQTATRTQTTGAQHSAIWITNTGSALNYSVSGNTIGFASNTGTGTYNFVAFSSSSVLIPIFLSVGTTVATSVQGNTIKAIAMSGAGSGTSSSAAFRGIYVSSGLTTIGDVTGNTIGDMSSTGSISYTSSSTSASDVMGMFNFGSSNWTVINNSIGGITAANSSTGASNVYGIRLNTGTSANTTIQNNTVGGNTANSLQSTTAATGSQVAGIFLSTSNATVSGNTVRNLTAAGGTGTTTAASVAGIVFVSTSVNNTVSQNTIHTLTNTNGSAATTLTGIQYTSSSGANLISRNNIHSFSAASTAAIVNGIQSSGGTATYSNNMARLGVDASGASITTSAAINGINETGGTNNHYFNSVYVGGSSVASGTVNTFAFSSTVTTNTRVFRNNIFYNARSNASGTGKHYSVRVGGTAPNPAGLTINNNIYLADGTGGVFGLFNSLDVADLPAWKVAVGQDAGSYSSDPQYINPTGTSSTVDLHIHPTNPTQVEGNGANIPAVTDDYDGQTRASLTPEDIGADAGNFTSAGDINPPVIAYTPLTFTCLTGDRALNGVTITDATGVPTAGALQPRVYYKKGIGGSWFSSQGSLAGGSGTSGTWNFTIVAADMGGLTAGDAVYYYVIAQDVAVTPNITSNPSAGLVATDVNTVTTPPTTPNTYLISATLNGSYNVGVGQTYTSISAAIAAYNTSCLGGPVTFQLTDASYTGETLPITINVNAGASSTNTLTIKPTLPGTSISGTGTAVFILNGADYVTIDGSTSGGTDRNLTISNSSTSTSSGVIWLQSNGADGATNNTIKNAVVTGNSNTTTLVGLGMGGSTISVSSLGTSNNSNTIRNNSITRTQYGIYSGGASVAAKNTGNTITQNLINGTGTNAPNIGGILMVNENNLTVTGNSIGNINASGTKYGISLGATSFNTYSPGVTDAVTNATVSGNTISSINCTGANSSFGIVICPSTTGTNDIFNNSISAINGNATPSDFTAGIYTGGGAGSTTRIYYNSISMNGSATRTTHSYALAIGGSNPAVDVRNNVLFNSSTTSGAANSYAFGTAYSTFTNLIFNYNDLFTTGANSQFAGVGSISAPTNQADLATLNTTIGGGANSISADPIFNSTTNLVPQVGSPVVGAGTPIGGITTDLLGTTRNGSTPSMGAYEVAADAIAPAISYTLLTTSCLTGDRALNGVTISDVSGVPTSGSLQPRVYYRKNAGSWFSSQGTLASGSATNGTWNFTIIAADMGGLAGGDAIQYYVIAQDIAGVPNISSNPSAGLVATDVNTVMTPPTTPNSVAVGSTLNGTYTVGGGGNYPTLTAAAIAYNNGCLTGPVIFELTDAAYSGGETFPISINLNPDASVTNTLLIRPTGTASVSGNAASIFNFNGARFVTIDGRIGSTGSTHSLTVTNASTSGTAITFINDATSNTIKYADLKSDNTATTSGVVLFGSTTGTNGNDNNAIDNCNIGPNAATPTNGVYSSGTTTTAAHNNSGNIISNNNIFDFYNSTSTANAGVGVNIAGGNTDWTIDGNSFYQTVTRTTFGDASTFNGIQINNSSGNNFAVTNNFIGGTAPNCGGTPMTLNTTNTLVIRLLQLTVGTTTATSVQGNTIQNIAVTTASASTVQSLISALTGNINIGTTAPNTLGSQSATGNVTFTQSTTSTAVIFSAIIAGTGTPGAINISNNTIGGIAVSNSSTGSLSLRGIGVQGAATSYTISGNTIGSTTTPNSMTNSTPNSILGIFSASATTGQAITNNTVSNLSITNTSTTGQLTGILLQGSSGGSFVTTGNIVRNLTNSVTSTGVGGSASIVGISHTAATTAGQTLSQNTVHGLSNTDAASATGVTGIHYAGPTTGTNIIARNFVYGLNLATTNAAGDIRGINFASGLANVQNNMIELGTTVANGVNIHGLYEINGTANSGIYFNSVFIGGSDVGTQAGNSYAFRSDQATNARIFQNNIFLNARSNATTGGKHYAVRVAGTTPNPTGLTLNYNDYQAIGIGGVFGFFNSADVADLAAWQVAVGQDANSISSNPQFIDPAGATPDLHIHATNPTSIEGAGLAIGAVTDDFDGQTRTGLTPTDLGADAGDFVAADISAPGISYTPLTPGCSTGDRALNGVIITDASGVPTSGALQPRVYYKKGIGGTWFSSQGTLASGSATNGTWNFTIVAADMGGLVIGDQVYYYVIAQDVSGNITSNPATGLVATDVNTVTTPPTTPNSYTINPTLSGTYTVGSGGDYATITAAVAAYNSATCFGGPVVFSLTDATYPAETFPIIINSNPAAGATNTLTIRPASAVTPLITGSSATSIFKLNGADYVTIDGSNNGGTSRDLTISNTNTGTSSGVIWVASASASDGATNNVLKNCVVSGNSATTTLAGIFGGGTGSISTSGVSLTNNSNLTIQNNTISKAQYGVLMLGQSTSALNTQLTVSGNTVGTSTAGDGFNIKGIDIRTHTGAVVSNNDVQNVAGSGSTNMVGIDLIDCQNATVSANRIHNMRYTGSSTTKIFALNTSTSTFNVVGNPSANTYVNNAVYDIASTATSSIWNISGINNNGGYGDKYYYNTVNLSGQMNASGTGPSAAFSNGNANSSAAAPELDIRNNIFNMNGSAGGAATLYAHYTTLTTYGTSILNYNDLYSGATGSATAQLGFFNSANSANLAAWQAATGQEANSQSGLPTFISATDPHLVAADANNFTFIESKGTAIGGFTTDIDGNTRPNGVAPDIGADEFVGSPPACGNVTNLVASAITSTSANLNWDVTPSAVGYEYAVTTSATPPGSGTTTTNNFVTPAGGLTPSTVYYTHVRSDCGSGNLGNWATISFTTACATITSLPWDDGFESLSTFGAGIVPLCWSTELISGTNFTSANSPVRNGLGARTGTNYMWSRWSSDAWLYTPAFDLTAGTSYDFSFYYRQTDAVPGFTITVAYGNAANAASMTNTLGVITDPINITYSQGKYTFTPSTSGTYYFGVHSVSPTSAPWYMEYDDFRLEVTPTCVAPTNPSMVATSATTATVSWTAASPAPATGYEWKVVLTGAGSGGAAVASGTTGAGVTTASATGLVNNVTYDVYVRSDCGGGTFSTYAGPFTYYLYDDAAGALTLAVGAGCTGAPYTNLNATASANELYPSCSGNKISPIWFKFVAPASGAVRISTDLGTAGDFDDSKMALFSTTDPANYANFTIISCDEDGGSSLGVGFMAVLYATGLTPGSTYYIAVDKFSSTVDNGPFCIAVDELDNTMLASNLLTCATNVANPVGDTPGYTGWIPLVNHDDSRLIALIRNPAGGMVQDYGVSMNVNPGAVRTDVVSGQRYLDRSFHLEGPGSPMEVQLFFPNSELTALQAVDPAVTLANLGVTRQTGATCQGDFVAANGTNSYIAQAGSGSVNGASWVSFSTNGFSNFYLHTNKAFLPVAVLLQGACPPSGVVTSHKAVTTTWANLLNANALNQPYNTAAFGNYNGTESVSAGFFTSTGSGTDITDWVLLELRDATTPSIVIKRRAAFVRVDGKVVDLNGTDELSFRGLASGNYFLVIRHRNHLGIRTATTRSLDGALGIAAPALYDFRSAQAQAFQDPAILALAPPNNNPAMKPLNGGLFALWGGNVNANTNVRFGGLNNDLAALLAAVGGSQSAVLNIYSPADINMDGVARFGGLNSDAAALIAVLGGNQAAVFSQHQ